MFDLTPGVSRTSERLSRPPAPGAAAGITLADINPTLGVAGIRQAASYANGSAGNTAGGALSFSWATSNTTIGFEYEFSMRVHALPTGTAVLLGQATAGVARLQLLSTGALDALVDGNTRAATASGVVSADGSHTRVKVRITNKSTTIWLNDAEVGSSSASNTLTATPILHYILGYGSTGERPVIDIWDVHIRDLDSDTNTALYTLDNGFANSHPGSTVAGAALTANAFVPFVLVNSTGAVKPVPAPGPLLVQMSRGETNQSLDGSVTTSYVLTFDSEDIDKTGAATIGTGKWIAPAPGRVMVQGEGRFEVSTVSDLVRIEIRKNLAFMRRRNWTTASGSQFSISAVDVVDTGDEVYINVDAIDPANTGLIFDYGSLNIMFFPTSGS